MVPVEAHTREISYMTMEYEMWSKPAPPADSGKATAVNPSSAALRKFSCGKRPVSSSSRASGFTSLSANSRTVRCSSFCSSLSSRFNAPLPVKTCQGERKVYLSIGVNPNVQASRAQGAAKFRVRRCQFFGLKTRFANRGHEICVAGPSREQVHMQVTGDSG